jgi:hypothetical protein
MKELLRREWLTLLIWGAVVILLWNAFATGEPSRVEAIGLLVLTLLYEFIARVFGTNKEDKA